MLRMAIFICHVEHCCFTVQAAFTRSDPKSAKKDVLTVFFALLGSVQVKAECKTFSKSTPADNPINEI